MVAKNESKHERFLRLAHRRLERSLEELRLLSQLASPNYENTPAEAEEIMEHLDGATRHIAEVFEVEYATRIGKAASKTTAGAPVVGVRSKRAPVLDEIECVKLIEKLRAGEIDEVIETMRLAVLGEKKAA